MEKTEILIVEDESIIALEMQRNLEKLGYSVVAIVTSGEQAIEKAEQDSPDLILMDIRIAGAMDGIEAAEIIRSRFDIPVVFATAYMDKERIERAKLTMPFGYLLKPIPDRDLQVTIEMALHVSQAEKKRKKVEERFKVFFRAINEAIMVHPFLPEGFAPFIEVNDIACERYGYTREEFLQLTPANITTTPHAKSHGQKSHRKKLLEEKHQVFETFHIKKNGDIFPVEISANIVEYDDQMAIMAVVRDISERKKTMEMMIQTEKMTSIGGMAAGMAHEINNPLGGMLQGVQTVIRRLSTSLKSNIKAAEETGVDLVKLQSYLEKREIHSFLTGIQESGKKASRIIDNMLRFSRKSESKIVAIDIVELVNKVLDLAGKDYNLKKKFDFRNINISKSFEPDLPPLPCTETEIEQVLINLLHNAAWAMFDQGGDEPPRISIRVFRKEELIRIEVEDNGPGMDSEMRKRIFEPFYTTKPVGEGTGLGLSVSYMIITNNHEGQMKVESEPGKGTTFIIQLPLNRQDID